MKYRKSALFGLSFVASVGFSAPAHAYLDPGTASMILQLAIGGAVGALVAVRLYWRRLKNFLFQRNGEREQSDQMGDQPD